MSILGEIWSGLTGFFGGGAEPSNPFSGMSHDDLMDQFLSENWGDTIQDPSRTRDLLQEVENQNAALTGRPPAKVLFFEGAKNEYGGYYGADNIIWVNQNNISNPFETLDTMIHEGNHAFQDQCLETSGVYNPHLENLMKAEKGDYISSDQSFIDYKMQSMEIDSNNAGVTALLSEADRFKDDEAYLNYLNERAGYYQELNNDLDMTEGRRANNHVNQADNALSSGKMTQEEHDELIQSLNDPESVSYPELRSHQLEDQINSVREQVADRQEAIKNGAEDVPDLEPEHYKAMTNSEREALFGRGDVSEEESSFSQEAEGVEEPTAAEMTEEEPHVSQNTEIERNSENESEWRDSAIQEDENRALEGEETAQPEHKEGSQMTESQEEERAKEEGHEEQPQEETAQENKGEEQPKEETAQENKGEEQPKEEAAQENKSEEQPKEEASENEHGKDASLSKTESPAEGESSSLGADSGAEQNASSGENNSLAADNGYDYYSGMGY